QLLDDVQIDRLVEKMPTGNAAVDRFKHVHGGSLVLKWKSFVSWRQKPCRRGGQLRGLRCAKRGRIVVHTVELRRRAVDVHLENVGAVVVPGEIMTKLHLDRQIEIALGVENTFL